MNGSVLSKSTILVMGGIKTLREYEKVVLSEFTALKCKPVDKISKSSWKGKSSKGCAKHLSVVDVQNIIQSRGQLDPNAVYLLILSRSITERYSYHLAYIQFL